MFTIKEYRNLLIKIKNYGYEFVRFTRNSFKKRNKIIFLRHDVDVSPKLALEMALLEAKLEIYSTYFFMIRSPFYNLFSRNNSEIVKKILKLGHDIGLHYDEGYYFSNNELQELIDNEIYIMEKAFNIKIKAVSFHQPSKLIIENKIHISQINTYDKELFKEIEYFSDSNMKLSMKNLEKILLKGNGIQLLIHPLWWTVKGSCPEDKFIEAMKINFAVEQNQILQTERAYGRKKIIEFVEALDE